MRARSAHPLALSQRREAREKEREMNLSVVVVCGCAQLLFFFLNTRDAQQQ